MKSYIEEAFQRLRGYCAKKTNCDNCHFATSDGDCVLNVNVPCEAYRTILEALDGMRWRPGSEKPTKAGEKAVCITEYGNVVLGEAISYQGELLWEEFTVYGGTFTPTHWMLLPEPPGVE